MAASAVSAVLTPVEATRISSVLEEALEKLSFLSSMTPDILAHRDEMSALVGDEISRIISDQRALELRYEALIEQRAGLKDLSHKNKYKELQVEIQNLAYQLRESMKNLCRSLKENPDVGENLTRLAEEREHLALLLEKSIVDLRSGHYRTLADFVSREHEARERLRAASNKEEEMTGEVEKLALALREEEDKYAAEADTKRAELSALKEQLRRLKSDTMLTLRYARKEASAITESTARAFAADEEGVGAAIDDLRAKIATETLVHEQSIGVLKAEQEELARMAEALRVKQAAEAEAKDAELKALTAERDAQATQLQALQSRYERNLADLAQLQAEAEEKGEAARYAAGEEKARKHAATMLQRGFFDMFCTVDALRKASKPKKKKKGGKEKKK